MGEPQSVPALKLEVRRTIKAPREKVFEAWTDPKHLKHWWGAGEKMEACLAEVDLRVGGQFRLGMKPKDGEAEYIATGEYIKIQPPEMLEFSFSWEGMEGPNTNMNLQFLEVDGGTEVILTHTGFGDENNMNEHEKGWNGCLDNLQKLLED